MAGLMLLRHAPWSSEAVEQGHAAASRLIRRHKDLGAKSCMGRALVMHMIPLFTAPPDAHRRAQLEARLETLQSLQVSRITGRHVYFGDLQQMAKTQMDLGKEIAIDAAKGITKKHSKFWNAMDEGRRAVFNARASELQDQKREQLRDRVGDTRVELDILRRRG